MAETGLSVHACSVCSVKQFGFRFMLKTVNRHYKSSIFRFFNVLVKVIICDIVSSFQSGCSKNGIYGDIIFDILIKCIFSKTCSKNCNKYILICLRCVENYCRFDFFPDTVYCYNGIWH